MRLPALFVRDKSEPWARRLRRLAEDLHTSPSPLQAAGCEQARFQGPPREDARGGLKKTTRSPRQGLSQGMPVPICSVRHSAEKTGFAPAVVERTLNEPVVPAGGEAALLILIYCAVGA